MDYPEFIDHVEKIEIRDFLSISSADIQIADVTALIGRQATGKSIIAKLIYFGRSYLVRFVHEVGEVDFSVRTFKSEQTSRFLELFRNLVGYEKPFRIEYKISDISIIIQRSRPGVRPKISHGGGLGRIGLKIRRDYQSYRKEMEGKKNRRSNVSIFSFWHSNANREKFYASIPNCLFVPASRSFYSTISQQMFDFLAAEKRIDPLTAQFGSFYEFAKRRVAGDWYGPERTVEDKRRIDKILRPVLDGEYVRIKSDDFIKTRWGRVSLPASSSGQQEALPLLLSLLEYPDEDEPSQLLIIEEPEAHLFPEAQKFILDLMADVARNTSCKMLFTTHSPYMLACLNNVIASMGNDVDVGVAAFRIDAGGVESIIDDPDGLIDLNYLDSVSEVIAAEFIEALS